jgi:GTPase SAR1 family protein
MPPRGLDDTEIQDLQEFKNVRLTCDRFRVLVIGKANAGKTTILKKMCGAAADEMPVVRDKNGVVGADFV